MRFNFHNVSVKELLVRHDLGSNNVSHIDDAVFILISVIIEKDVLCVLVRLVNQQRLCNFSMEIIFLPVFIIVADSHRAALLQGLDNGHVLIDWSLVELQIVVAVIVKQVVDLVKFTYFSL